MEEKPVRKSIKKRVFRSVLNLLLVIFWIPFALTFLFQDPIVQTQAARLATNVLSRQLGNKIMIKRLKLDISSGISLHGVKLKDHHDSTMISLKTLTARPIFRELGLLTLRFSEINIDSAVFRYGRYKNDEEFNLKIFLLKMSGDEEDKKETKDEGSFHLFSRNLILRNSVFHLFDQTKEYDNPGGMDYADMMFNEIQLNARGFEMIDDSLTVMIDSLQTIEKCGLRIEKLSAFFTIANSGLTAKDLFLNLPNSSIDMDLAFKTTSYKTYSHFIDSVDMYGFFRPTSIDMSEIGYFSGVMNEMPNEIGVTGVVSGTVSDLKGEDLRVHYLRDTRLSCNARIKGLPDFYTSYMEADIKEFSTTACDIRMFSLPIEERNLDYTNEFECGDKIVVNGDFKGYYKDFVSNLNIRSGEGNLEAHINFTEKENDTVYFGAQLVGIDLNLGHVLHQEETLDEVNMDINVNGYGHDYSDLKINVDGIVHSIDLLGYRYNRMRIDGSYFADTISANIRVGDKHLMMDASGYMTLHDIPDLNVKAGIQRLDLYELGFYQDKDLRVAGNAKVRIKGFEIPTMEASILLQNNTIAFGKEVYKLDSLKLDKYVDTEGLNVIDLRSTIADANLKGKYNIENFPDQLINLFNSYIKLLPKTKEKEFDEGEYAELYLNIKRDALLEEQFLSGIDLYPPYAFNSSMNFDEKQFELSSDFEKLGIGGTILKDNVLRVNTVDNRITLDYTNSDIIIKDSSENDKTVFGLDDFRILIDAGNDSLVYDLSWENADTLWVNKGKIDGKLTTYDRVSRFNISHAEVYINDTLWRVDPDNMIVSDSTGLRFEELLIYGGMSSLNLFGTYPKKDGDSLNVNFNDWNLSNFDIITNLFDFDLGGILNGDLNISVVDRFPAIVSDITIDSLYLNDVYMGVVELFNSWNNESESVSVKSRIVREGSAGQAEVFSLNGYYYPFRNENSVDLKIAFNRLNLKSVGSFIQDFVSKLEGSASGKMELKGSVSDPLLTGNIELRRTSMVVNYLNTKYSFSNEIIFEPERVSFDKLVIYDTLGNFAKVDGFLQHKYFKDQEFKIRISTDKLLFFNTTRKMNDLYYGTAITSGDINISGSPRNIKLDMDVKTMKGTDVSLPLDYSVEISDKDYIIFIDHNDTLEFEEEEPEGLAKLEQEKLAYDLSLKMKITPDALVTIYMPSDMGRIESQGDGDLRMLTNSNGDFRIIGDYIVDKGIFHFTLANLVRKRFSLIKGGRISWTGDPYTANVNIKGLYKVHTSLSSLGVVFDTTASYKNKVMVDCYIVLSNQLLNPDIRFEIKMPSLDPDQQRVVYSALDTTNQAVMNEQMISLLVLGTFSASNAANISLSSSYYAVLTNQLSSMLSKISDDFDIGVNYKPGDTYSQEEFEVALSTQLFDDRLMIDGHFGMTYDKGGQNNASNIVGDVDVGYKLTTDGRWILKAYNHSNVNSWYNSLEKISPYTQGVGVAFRKEFTSLVELFQRTRPRKKDKAKLEEENGEIIEDEEL